MTRVRKFGNTCKWGRMPNTKVFLYKERDGTPPILAWLDNIPKKARLKCIKRIERLREEGHQLRRPEADLLRDKIHSIFFMAI